jgi:hypothetical protein
MRGHPRVRCRFGVLRRGRCELDPSLDLLLLDLEMPCRLGGSAHRPLGICGETLTRGSDAGGAFLIRPTGLS